MTEEQKAKYLEGGGVHCPYCGSDNIVPGKMQDEEDRVEARTSCVDCGKEWLDIFRLTDVEPICECGCSRDWHCADDGSCMMHGCGCDGFVEDKRFCKGCGCHHITHNDDGSCVEDD